jgi:hypothetical protein
MLSDHTEREKEQQTTDGRNLMIKNSDSRKKFTSKRAFIMTFLSLFLAPLHRPFLSFHLDATCVLTSLLVHLAGDKSTEGKHFLSLLTTDRIELECFELRKES